MTIQGRSCRHCTTTDDIPELYIDMNKKLWTTVFPIPWSIQT